MAQGREYFPLRFAYITLEYDENDEDSTLIYKPRTIGIGTTWEDISTTIAHTLVRRTPESAVRTHINEVFYKQKPSWRGLTFRELRITEDSFQDIRAQARALGVVEVTEVDEPTPETYWRLTSKGDIYMVQARVLRKNDR